MLWNRNHVFGAVSMTPSGFDTWSISDNGACSYRIFNLILMIWASMACHVERKAGKQAAQPKLEDA